MLSVLGHQNENSYRYQSQNYQRNQPQQNYHQNQPQTKYFNQSAHHPQQHHQNRQFNQQPIVQQSRFGQSSVVNTGAHQGAAANPSQDQNTDFM